MADNIGSRNCIGRILSMIRILIADDSKMVQDGLNSLLSAQTEFCVVGLAGDGAEAVEKARDLRPDLVVMDAQMPNVDGIEATRRIKAITPEVRIIVLAVFSGCLEAGLQAGADGYLPKDCEPHELISRIIEIAG